MTTTVAKHADNNGVAETKAQRLGLANPEQRVPSGVVFKDRKVKHTVGSLQFEVTEDRKITLTKKVAQRYIDLPVFVGEREVRDTRVQQLVDLMVNGYFNASNVILATAELKGVTYKINGQHTSWAVFLHPNPDFQLEGVHQVHYKVTNEDQLRALYGTFDRNLGRSEGHVITTAVAGRLDGVWPSYVSLLGNGMRYWLGKLLKRDRRSIRAEEVSGYMLKEYPDLIKTVAQFIQGDVNQDFAKSYRKAPIVGAIIACFAATPTKAPEFWTPVITGLDIHSKGDPRRQLRELLMRVTSQKAKKGQTAMTLDEQYGACVSAWNHWRAGEEVRSLRPTKAKAR